MANQKIPAPSEQAEQMAIFKWASAMSLFYPKLKLLHATLAGNVKVSFRELNKVAKMGAKKGVPDIFLPVVSGPWSGLWIELKKRDGSGRVTDEQRQWLQALSDEGYYACVCMGSDAAIGAIEEYLGFKREDRRGKPVEL